MDVVLDAVTSWEFWATWVFGPGFIGFLLFELAKWMLGRVAARRAADGRKADARWEVGRVVADQLISSFERVRTHLQYLDITDNPGRQRRLGEKTGPEQRLAAADAVTDTESLVVSKAGLLPSDLGEGCHALLRLVKEFQVAKRLQGLDRWDGQKLMRAEWDIRNYLGVMNDALTQYARSGEVAPFIEPPVLRRDDPASWTKPEGPVVGTLWERTRSKLANWDGTT